MMKKHFLFTFFFLLGSTLIYAQIGNVVEKFNMPVGQIESSGLIFYNGKLITHNDSGGENKLFELDTITGLVTREVTVANATNIDWEDITQDDGYIYVGDIGNNSGNRTDLVIYKIAKLDYDISDTVSAAFIAFSYVNQTDFTPAPNNTVWDAEALLSSSDTSLLLFSKDWVSGTALAYTISKTPGSYALLPMTTSLANSGLITGATFNPLSSSVFLTGYSALLMPFVWQLKDFDFTDVFSGINSQYFLTSLSFEQLEALCYVDANNYLASSESFNIPPFSDVAKLIAFKDVSGVSASTDIALAAVKVYPNPVASLLYVEVLEPIQVILINSVGQVVLQENIFFSADLDMAIFSKGVYTLKLISEEEIITKRIVKI